MSEIGRALATASGWAALILPLIFGPLLIWATLATYRKPKPKPPVTVPKPRS